MTLSSQALLTASDLNLILNMQCSQDFVLLIDKDLTCIQHTGLPIHVLDTPSPNYEQLNLHQLLNADYVGIVSNNITKLVPSKDIRWSSHNSNSTLKVIHTDNREILYLLIIQPENKAIIPIDNFALEFDNHDLVCRMTSTGIIIHVNQSVTEFWGSPVADLISTSFFRYCAEYEVPTLNHKFKNLAQKNPTFVIDVRMKNGNQPQRWVKWSFHGIFDSSGNLAEIQAVGYDITDHQRAQIAEKRQRNLAEAMRNISTVLNSSLDLDKVLEHIIDIIHLVVAHDTVNVMLVEDNYATVVRSNGYGDHNIRGMASLKLRIPRIKHLRYMMETKTEIVIPNVETYPEPSMGIPEMAWVKSYVGAPIVSEDQVIGFLNLESMTPYYFEMEHAELVRAFANHAAIAIRNAQLYKQAQRVAIIEERQRLARELHDAVSQTLFSANMIADSLPIMWEKQPENVFGQLLLLRQQTQLAMSELRAMLFELRPQTLADTNVRQLLGQLLQSLASRGMVDTNLLVEGDDSDILLDIKIAFYRIAQEAINNAIQHAHATYIEVKFISGQEHFLLSIQDNGQGFDLNIQSPGHMGLQIMQDRAKAIDAELTIDSHKGKGTMIQVVYQQQGEI